jgi:hypothetical protein
VYSYWLVHEDKSVRLKRLNATSAEQRFNKENPSDSPTEMRKWPKMSTRASLGEYSPKVSFKRNNRLSVKGSFFDLLTDGDGRTRRSFTRRRRSHDGRALTADFLNTNGYIQPRSEDEAEVAKDASQADSNQLPHIVVDAGGETEATETDSLMQRHSSASSITGGATAPVENRRLKPTAPPLHNGGNYQQVPNGPDRVAVVSPILGIIASKQETFM